MGYGRAVRPIGEPVRPPRMSGKPPKVYHSGIKKKHVMKRVMKRTLWVIPMLLGLFITIPLLLFSPLIIAGLTADPIEWGALLIPVFPMILIIPILFISVPIGLIIAYRSVASSIPENRVEISNGMVKVSAKISGMTPPRIIEVPLGNIEDVIEADRSYMERRKKESRFYHRMAYHRFKPRTGDYFSSFSRPEDLIIMKLRTPMMVPYFDYKWTGTEQHGKQLMTDDIVIDIERPMHYEFKNEVKRLRRIMKEEDEEW
ncbi:MAG: hypothetical protein ACMUIE_10505 [Thermoplasmatota archaeon]